MTELRDLTMPSHVPPSLVREWDHYSGAALLQDPTGCYDELREAQRAFYSPLYGGFWVFTRYEDIHAALQNPSLWSSDFHGIPARNTRLLPLNLDPPDHTRYRRLIGPAFSPGRIASLETSMRMVTRDLLDAIPTDEEIDFIDVFAKPFPSAIFAGILGLPVNDWRRLMAWDSIIIHSHDADARDNAILEVIKYLEVLIEDRQSQRQDDLLSTLIDAEVDGERLRDDELLSFAVLLFMAGLDTVTAALGFIFGHLSLHAADRQQLVDSPSQIPDAVEELLRVHSFVQLPRMATEDAVFGGVQVKKGDRALLPLAPAGRDPEAFPNADVVDFQREPNRHLAFGVGPHRCVGSHLARLELRVALEEWHERYPAYGAVAHRSRIGHGGGVTGLAELWVRVEGSR